MPKEVKIDVSKEAENLGFEDISSLKIRKVSDSSDAFWSILSLGLYIPQTYEISGRSSIK
jgi:hypothetical protein